MNGETCTCNCPTWKARLEVRTKDEDFSFRSKWLRKDHLFLTNEFLEASQSQAGIKKWCKYYGHNIAPDHFEKIADEICLALPFLSDSKDDSLSKKTWSLQMLLMQELKELSAYSFEEGCILTESTNVIPMVLFEIISIVKMGHTLYQCSGCKKYFARKHRRINHCKTCPAPSRISIKMLGDSEKDKRRKNKNSYMKTYMKKLRVKNKKEKEARRRKLYDSVSY